MEGAPDYEFFPTPAPLTRWMMAEVRARMGGISRRVLEPCAGAGDISVVLRETPCDVIESDLDPRWNLPIADATLPAIYLQHQPHWCVTNFPFSLALPILEQMLLHASRGVAAYHRITLKEPLKTEGLGRSFFREHPPTMTLYCPRFAHQRSRKTGQYSTDSACCVWSVWRRDLAVIGDVWPPDAVFDELRAYEPTYRSRLDVLNGLHGTEKERQAQWQARWAKAA